jgi:hypothetical protein
LHFSFSAESSTVKLSAEIGSNDKSRCVVHCALSGVIATIECSVTSNETLLIEVLAISPESLPIGSKFSQHVRYLFSASLKGHDYDRTLTEAAFKQLELRMRTGTHEKLFVDDLPWTSSGVSFDYSFGWLQIELPAAVQADPNRSENAIRTFAALAKARYGGGTKDPEVHRTTSWESVAAQHGNASFWSSKFTPRLVSDQVMENYLCAAGYMDGVDTLNGQSREQVYQALKRARYADGVPPNPNSPKKAFQGRRDVSDAFIKVLFDDQAI